MPQPGPPPLADSDSHSRAVLAAALDPIITINASGVIQSASDSVLRVFGWSPGELIGRNVSVLMPEPHRSAHDGYLARYAATGQTRILNHPRRLEAVRRDGSRFPIELSVSQADIPTMAGPLFVGIIRDLTRPRRSKGPRGTGVAESQDLQGLVTEQTRALEQAHLRLRLADQMASIGTLAAGLGHDMNNVLLPVRAQINVLREASRDLYEPRAEVQSRARKGTGQSEAPGIDIRPAIDAIASSVAYLQQLADGLHALAQNPDNTHPDGPPTDVRDWWDRTGIVISKGVPKHVKLTASIPPQLPPVSVAPHRLTQAVLNLVINAGEAIPSLDQDPSRKRRQGRVKITARSEGDRSGTRWIALSVSDNGGGMTAEVKRRAFELFFTTKSRGRGTGLGLPLVHKVAARVGGRVEIDTLLGKGTTVTMWLPEARVPSDARIRHRAVIAVSNARMASLVRHVLEAAGVQIVDASENLDRAVLCVDDESVPVTPKRGRGKAVLDRKGSRRLIIAPTDDFKTIRELVANALACIPAPGDK
ncbi:MAG: PAS domain S-box protein [Leptolyngbya sp. PLA1]|nr:PAS domain S-box protein [Leptolyngbya sp. PLA1]